MKKILLIVGAMLFIASSVLAQDDPKPEKYKNVSWHTVVKIDYKSGKVSRAKQIIKMYEAAGAEAGTKGPEKFWFSTGKYDAMFIWTMEGGPADLEWWRTEDNIKWRAAMIKQVSSEEKLKKIQEEFSSLVASSTSEICRKEL